MNQIFSLRRYLFVFFFAAPLFMWAGGGGSCGPSDNCSSASSLTENTTYSFDNTGCDAIADCEDCFTLGGAACNNICGCAPCANEDCNTELMGKVCSINGAFCGSPENTSWGEFCPTRSGSYDFTVSNVSCSGGGASLQFGIYAGGVTCGNNNQGNMLDCSGGVTANTTFTQTLTAGQCYLIVFDGNAGATCTWDFLITGPPLAVRLESMEASPEGEDVRVQWRTSIEPGEGEFKFVRKYDNLVREEGLSADEQYNKMTSNEIHPLPGSVTRDQHGDYQFWDRTVREPGLYLYELYLDMPDGNQRFLGITEAYVNFPEKTRMIRAFNGPGKDNYTFEFQVTEPAVGALEVFSSDGIKVREVTLGRLDEGIYRKTINLAGLSSGVYIYNISLNGQSIPGKIIRI